jgi:PAS domain S-box-containing protein
MYQVKDKGKSKGANPAKSKRHEKPSLRENESARLAALCGYQILDTPSEESFDAFTRAAALICGTPTALITLVGAEHMWFKSRVGLAARQGLRKGGFCNHSIQQADVFIVPDARTDERFASHPMVIADPYIRFYAGTPLITPDGHALGTLCVIDYVPRQLSLEQIAALRGLGQEVMTQIELRRKNLELEPMRGRLEMILDVVGEGIYGLDTEGLTTFVNSAAARMLGWEINDLLGKSMHDVLHHSYPDGTPYPREHCPINAACKEGNKNQQDNEVFWRKDGSFFFVKYTSTPIIQAGKCLGTVVVFEDITEHKRLEELARRERQFLSVLLDNLEEGIVACNAEGIFTLFNQASRKFYGPEVPLPPEQWAEHFNVYFPDGKTPMATSDIPLYRALQGEVVRNVEPRSTALRAPYWRMHSH